MKPIVIAYYLPQYHPFKENDEWWGKGFTEWTNVARATPLYKNHYQPKIPSELGFYDLRLPIIREEQAKLAKEAGVYGFCYWHYWFGNGKQLMQDIFDDVLDSGKPDFPFCLGWANHSWFAKNWNTNDSKKDKLLIEQKYLGESDYRQHYDKIIKAFKDPRYIKINGKPIFTIFNPKDLPNEFIKLWDTWAKEDGFEGIYFIASYKPTSIEENDYKQWIEKGYSSVIPVRLNNDELVSNSKAKKLWIHSKKSALYYLNRIIGQIGFMQKKNYSTMINYFANKESDKKEEIIPTLIPNFDHSPRSKKNGYILEGSSPELFEELCDNIFNNIKDKKNQIVWLRSWNEWGEGNYMEPDIKYGRGFINALRNSIEKIK